MCKVSICFTADLDRIPFVPQYYFRTNDTEGIYDFVERRTGDHDLAADLAGWAELAPVYHEYEHDLLIAEIIDEDDIGIEPLW